MRQHAKLKPKGPKGQPGTNPVGPAAKKKNRARRLAMAIRHQPLAA
jgi:hypothetical protein